MPHLTRGSAGTAGARMRRFGHHDLEQPSKSHAAGLEFREQQLVDVVAFGRRLLVRGGGAAFSACFCGFAFVIIGPLRCSRRVRKSRAQFLLPVDFHGVGGFARHPVYSHCVASLQSNTQRFDMFQILSGIRIDGASRIPFPPYGVVFAVALGLAQLASSTAQPDRHRFVGTLCFAQPRRTGIGSAVARPAICS